MFFYILKRLLIFIPTIFVISAVIFSLNATSSCDAAEAMLGLCQEREKDVPVNEADFRVVRKKMGLDKPLFYISLASLADSDTLYHIPHHEHRELLSRLVNQFGNWNNVSAYYGSLRQATATLETVPTDTLPSQYLVVLKDKVQILYHTTAPEDIKIALKTLQTTADTSRFYTIKAIIADLIVHYENLEPSATRWKNYIPVINLNGSNNQYHTWIINFLHADFGISYMSKRLVYDELGDVIFWSMLFTGTSLFLVYLLAIPLGVYSARRRGTPFDNIISTILFAIHSVPSFWTGTLLIIFFCQPAFLNWFPPYGLGDASVAEDGWGVTISTVVYHLILPVFCLTYSNLAFLSRQMRGAMLESLRQDYIRTAWAKGATEKKIAWKHAFRNSLLPMITLFGTVFPHLVAGSVVIETIFTLPGMGRPLLTAIMSHDYPIVFTIVMLTSILTMIGNLVGDVLYAVFDPRIRFDSK